MVGVLYSSWAITLRAKQRLNYSPFTIDYLPSLVLFDDRFEPLRCRLRPEVWRGEDGVAERGAAGAGVLRLREAADGLAHDGLRVADVLVEVLDHRFDRDGVVVFVPAVVVRDERERGVTDFGLARELRLLKVRHADDVHAPGAVDVRLGHGREGRAFHAEVRAAAVGVNTGGAAGLFEHVAEVGADRVRE